MTKLQRAGCPDCEGSVISPSGNLTSQPVRVSWVQAENTRVLGQRQRTPLLMVLQTTCVGICFSFCLSLTEVKPNKCSICDTFVSQLRNPKIRKSKFLHNSLQIDLPNFCSRREYYLYYTDRKQTCHLFHKEKLSPSSKVLCYVGAIKTQSGTKAAFACMMYSTVTGLPPNNIHSLFLNYLGF